MRIHENVDIDASGNIIYTCPVCEDNNCDIIFQDVGIFGEYGSERFHDINLIPISVCCKEEI